MNALNMLTLINSAYDVLLSAGHATLIRAAKLLLQFSSVSVVSLCAQKWTVMPILLIPYPSLF